jgi:hypothetical protein
MLTGSLTRSGVESMAATASAEKLETAEARLGVDCLRQPQLRGNHRQRLEECIENNTDG